jgi:hypothetical protein
VGVVWAWNGCVLGCGHWSLKSTVNFASRVFNTDIFGRIELERPLSFPDNSECFRVDGGSRISILTLSHHRVAGSNLYCTEYKKVCISGFFPVFPFQIYNLPVGGWRSGDLQYVLYSA